MKLRFGLAAWSNDHFDNALYPLGTRHAEYLPRYATVFPIAEADRLHHVPPTPDLFQQWIDQTPKGFLFLPKMWKKVTHDNGGEAAAKTWLEALQPLRDAKKLGPILLQFPPQMTREKGWDFVSSLLRLEDQGAFTVEVRHTSWFVPAFEELLTNHEAPLVWGTHPKAFTPPWSTASVGFLRFTGTYLDVKGRYVTQGDRLDDILEIRKRLAQATWKEAFVVVTNPFEGNAVDSMPRIAAALGDEALAKRTTRKPGEVLFPGENAPAGNGQKTLS